MESDVRTKILARLAERGLSIRSFDDQTLVVHYDAEKDPEAEQGQAVDAEELTRFARAAIMQPGSRVCFRGYKGLRSRFPSAIEATNQWVNAGQHDARKRQVIGAL